MSKEVSEAALLSRINQAMAPASEKLRKCRHTSRWFGSLGEYYLVNVSNNTIAATDISLEALAKELGVLRDTERLAA